MNCGKWGHEPNCDMTCGAVRLTHTLKKIPGEVDCLVYHRAMGVGFVTECKVLGYPHSLSRMRNLLLKLGESDSEGFFGKLRNKTQWIGGSDYFSGLAEDCFLSILMLDRKLPGHYGSRRMLDIRFRNARRSS
jgi:hypothetical protein